MISEINILNRNFNRLIHMVAEQRNEMESLSLLDGLTGIPNRRAFEMAFSTAWRAMLRNKEPMAVLMCDIDYFKPYNDNYGHQAGDAAITAIANALHNRIARPNDFVARYGGEEFVVVLPNTNAHQCQQLLDDVLCVIAELAIKHEYSDVSNIVSLSIGVSVISSVDENLQNRNEGELLKKADNALYQAKNAGRDRYVIQDFKDFE